MKVALQQVIDFISKTLSKEPSDFEINYGWKEWTQLSKFLDGIRKLKNDNIVIANAYYKGSHNLIVVDNGIINRESLPLFGSIAVTIAYDEDFFKLDEAIQFITSFSGDLGFEYGYITKLSDKYDFTVERKIKNGLFSSGIDITPLDSQWVNHSYGIKEGFIKKVYAINFLNDSQLRQSRDT